MSQISFFRNGISNVDKQIPISISDIYVLIKSKKYKEQINNIRKNIQNEEIVANLKRKLDYFMTSGVINYRSEKYLKNFIPSGYICIDIDKNITKDLKNSLKNNKYTCLLFDSPSGNNRLKLIIKIPKTIDPKEFTKKYYQISKYLNLESDNSGSDITRACFVSYDPDVYLNLDSDVFNLDIDVSEDIVKIKNNIKLKKTSNNKEIDPICKYIKDNINITQLLTEWNINIVDDTHSECPFHDSIGGKPFVRDDNNSQFKCFHTDCNKKGSIFDLVMYKEKCDFITAKKILMKKVKIPSEIIKKSYDEYFSSKIFDKYNFFWLKSETGNKYYNINEKGKNNYYNYNISGLCEYLIYDNDDIFELLNIPTFDKQGKPLLASAKTIKLRNKLTSYLHNNTIIVKDIKYKPGDNFLFFENDERYINSYITPIIHKNNYTNFKYIIIVLKNLGVTDEGYDYFLKWLAYILQNPSEKLSTSIILMGTHGTGKNIFFDTVIKRLFGDSNATTITQNTIESGWDDYFRNKQIIAADEIRIRNKETIERLKSITSNRFCSFKIKHKNNIEEKNYSHWIFMSNQEVPFSINENDRRFTILKQNKKIDTNIVSKLIENIDNEIYPFYQYLINLVVKRSDVDIPLINDDKNDIIEQSLPNFRKFFNEMQSYSTFHEFYKDYMLIFSDIDEEYISVSCFYNVYKIWNEKNNSKSTTKQKFTKDIKNYYGLESELKRINSIKKRVYNIKDLLKTDN